MPSFVLLNQNTTIRSLNDIITKCLVGTGSYWPLYIAPATFAMNCQVSQVTGFSSFQMVYSKPPPDKLAFDFDPIKSGIKLDTKLYMLCMQQQKLLIDQMIMRRKKYEAESQLIRESRKHPDAHGYHWRIQGGRRRHVPPPTDLV